MIDRALCERAAAGDQAAFGLLVQGAHARIHGLVSSFVHPDIGLEREDAYQLAMISAWKSVKSGRLNPHADFYAQISRSVRHSLITECERLRAECRWTGRPPSSIEEISLDDGAPVLGSWVTHADPLRVVLAREELRACWSLTTEHQRQAIARWLGGDTSKKTTDALTQARRKVKPMLADPYGAHPTLQVDRRCRHCGGSLAGSDIRATVHRACSRPYRWRQELAAHSTALRLV